MGKEGGKDKDLITNTVALWKRRVRLVKRIVVSKFSGYVRSMDVWKFVLRGKTVVVVQLDWGLYTRYGPC